MRAATIARGTAIGIAAGLAASAIMNGFQAGWSALQPSEGAGEDDEPTTVKAADKIARATTGELLPDEQRSAAGQLVHYGFGALLGGLYGAAGSVLPKTRSGFGLPFAAAVWATADEAAVPAAGLSGPPQETPASTHAYSLISHLVFGAALEGGHRAATAAIEAAVPAARQERLTAV